ncbi:protein hu-li tai shao isoform X5 [Centruroides vittatus]|uniref:protein hu-li tai shao isoform X5 n=1 Tax=Centruroides vittatus TaxID=120091 RepID=UPI00350ED7D9
MEAKVNGVADEDVKAIDKFDPDDPECQRQMWRPADIEQDMKEMIRRKRVEMIMNSQVFREELERIIDCQLSEGYVPANLSALQQVTELLLPHNARSGTSFRSGRCVIPINDIRGVDGLKYAKGEKLLRCKLAGVYRLIDLYGWSESMFNHITVRLSQDQEHFLLNPFGLQYHEITASSLLKVDMQGNVIDPGTTNFSFNRSGFVLHSAIHAARPDIKCVIHIHYPTCVAVSATKCGLLPISQEAAVLGEVSYHDFHGIPIDQQEREQIARSLGPINKVLILRNRGVVTCGESIEEAVFLLHNIVAACETQVRLMPIGLDNIQLMTDDTKEKIRDLVINGAQRQLSKAEEMPGGDEDKEKAEPKEKPKKWKVWDLEFEALMRMLDNAGFRTGYVYRQPLVKSEAPRQKTDVEVPPAATSASQYFDEDKWLSPLRKLMEGRKTQDKMRWVISPNVYQKVEVLETGTTEPKKITKWVDIAENDDNGSWVQEGSPSHSTSIKIQSPHQFVPKSGDPNEFKRKQKELKANRMSAKVNAGPQSQILEGVTWEEVRKMQDAMMSGTGDQVVLVGAASKGIIQRDFQHNALVYKSAYAKNPFDSVSDKELEEYKKLVEKRQRGELVEEEIPDEIKPLLVEPVRIETEQQQHPELITTPVETKSPPKSPVTPASEEDAKPAVTVQRSLSARLPKEDHSEKHKTEEQSRENYFKRRFLSERKKKNTSSTVMNGDEKIKRTESGDVSAASRSSKEGSPGKDISEESPKKDKKKKKGLKTPSFLKKKKHKKDKEKEKGSTET